MSYQQIITAATGVTDRSTLDAIEDSMRNDIFHSTLDWQSRKQLSNGARQAYGLVRVMRRPHSPVILPEDAETAKLLGVDVADIPALSDMGEPA